MKKVVIGNDMCMITGIREETPVFPVVPRGRRLTALFVSLIAVALLNVWLSGNYYKTGYAVSAALEEQRNLKKQQELLKTEILTLRSPSRIGAIARNELGMVDMKTDRILQVR